MSICVEIEIDDSGAVTVGVCPPDEEATEPKDYMKPAESIGVALEKARSLLQPDGGKPKTMQDAMFPKKEQQATE